MDDINWAGMAEQRRRQKKYLAPCKACLRQLILAELYDYVYENDVVTETEAMHACYTIARKLTGLNGLRHTSVAKVRLAIHNMRKDYINFRKFCKIPGVVYDSEYNYLEVTEQYMNGHKLQETEKEKSFREDGFVGYESMHFIFRKKKFPMFDGEPQIYWVDPQVYSDSSDEGSE